MVRVPYRPFAFASYDRGNKAEQLANGMARGGEGPWNRFVPY
jgi:hypothetical protein